MTTKTLGRRYTTDVPRRSHIADETIRKIPLFTTTGGRFETERLEDGDLGLFLVDEDMRGAAAARTAPINSVGDLARHARAVYSGDADLADRRHLGTFHMGARIVAEADGDRTRVFLIIGSDENLSEVVTGDHGAIRSVGDLQRHANTRYARR